MAPQPDDLPLLTGREKTIAQAVATLLEPLLTRLEHKLDAISAQLEAILNRLDTMVVQPDPAPVPHPKDLSQAGIQGGAGRKADTSN
jgi:hypothetical protein